MGERLADFLHGGAGGLALAAVLTPVEGPWVLLGGALILFAFAVVEDFLSPIPGPDEPVEVGEVHCRECDAVAEDPHAVSTPVGPDYYCAGCCPACLNGSLHADGGE